jgi:branched-chain amino acid transport system permease protein
MSAHRTAVGAAPAVDGVAPQEPARRPRRRPVAGVAWTVAVVAVLVLLPLPLPSYLQDTATRVLVFALLAMSLDLVYGYGGMISLGHAAFFGAGGYAVGLLMVDGGIGDFWVGAAVAVGCAAVLSAVIGFVALRTRGIYFILVTFALGQLVYSLAQQWSVLHTGGAEAVVGISQPDIPPFDIDWDSQAGYYFTLAVVLVATAVLFWLTRSRFGSVLRGIRENEMRLSAMGVNTWLYKYVAFIVSGAFAGLAGVLFAYSSGIMAPSNVGIAESGLIVLMIILGSTGRLFGAAIGAVVVVLVQFVAEQVVPEHENMVLGVVFVLAVLLLRGGIVARVERLAATLWRSRHAHPE